MQNPHIRNIAIIAHVDHGKTTLVDFMLRQSGTFRAGQEVTERVMDNMDLERERGITIAAKNCSISWKDVKINILDTPGHADFGGEVERALMMVDGVVLLVDSAEGPLPQTRFVLRKALEANLGVVVVINKIDRKDAQPAETLNAVYDLFIDLDAREDQLDFPVIYAIGRDGIAQKSLTEPAKDLSLLFDTIVSHIPPPSYDPSKPFQMLVTNLAYSDYLGRLAVGRVFNGSSKQNDTLVCIGQDGKPRTLKVTKVQSYKGVKLEDLALVEPGDIIIISGIDQVEIGDTICTQSAPEALKRITIDEPTISMRFSVNSSPFSGQDGKFVQAQRIYERLKKETMYNVALRLEGRPEGDSFVLKGRGEFQMAIVIEQMRREGYEMSVARPQIIYKEVDGKRLEPIERLLVDCDEAHIGVVTEKMSFRKGRMTNMINHGTGRVRLEFSVPSRGLIGYRSQFLTDTRGAGIMNSYLEGYEEYRGDIISRVNGSLVSDRAGEAVAYGMYALEDRGKFFVVPGDAVYEGMIVGEHNRENDLNINVCRAKKLTNIRAASKDENIILTPVTPMTLEKAIDFIRDDELVEVTPKVIRLRKISLSPKGRAY